MHGDDLLNGAIDAMRSPVPIRPGWREALLREIAAVSPPSTEPSADAPYAAKRRVWTMRPLSALAAAVACMIVGLGAGVLLSRSGTVAHVASVPNVARKLTTVRFVIVAPQARQVSLVGDFNQWDVGANPMRPSRDGQSWVLEVPLAPGRHTYAFVVDGDVLRDPSAPTLVDDDFGVRNSIIFVGDSRT